MNDHNDYVRLPVPHEGLMASAATTHGLRHGTDGWYGPFGMYGVELDADGLWRAVGPDGRRA